MYKFVKLIHDEINKFQNEHPDIANTNQHYHPKIKEVVDEFSKKYGLNYNLAQDVCRDIIDSKWVDEQYIKINNAKVAVFCKNRKTRQLVEGVPFLRPGLINEWMKEFGQTFTISIALLAFIVSIIALQSKP